MGNTDEKQCACGHHEHEHEWNQIKPGFWDYSENDFLMRGHGQCKKCLCPEYDHPHLKILFY
jgi:hypothetical protein